jgi:hypothetical protein
MSRGKSVAITVTGIVLCGSLAALAFGGGGGVAPASSEAAREGPEPSYFGTATLGDGSTSVLTRPAEASDVVTERTLDLHGRRPLLSDASHIRFAKAAGPVRVFVAPARREIDVCLVVEDATEQSTAIDCAPRSVLTKGAIYISKPHQESKTIDLFALVSDGVSLVESTPVANNIAIIWDFPRQTITLTNDAGQTSIVDLGPQFAP